MRPGKRSIVYDGYRCDQKFLTPNKYSRDKIKRIVKVIGKLCVTHEIKMATSTLGFLEENVAS